MSLSGAKGEIDRAFDGEAKGLAYENAFAGAMSFLRRRYTKDLTGVDLVVTGIPFDQAVTHRTGARMGPRAIREASCLQPFDPPYGWDGFDPLSEFTIADYGDVAFDYAHTPSFPGLVTDHIARILAAGIGTVGFGGDHYVTLPILRAYAAKYGPMSVVQFDAHSDLWPDDDPDRIDHGTFMYKAVREGIVDVTRSLQVGIRTECADYLGMPYIDARTCHEKGVGFVVEEIRRRVADHPTYITFDIDGLDPAFAPGTGTPVWGGLASWQVAAILRDLAGINVVGGDVVEVAPAYDTTGATAVAAAHVAMELCCLALWNKRKKVMPAMPISGNDLARFSGPQTFMRLPEATTAERLDVGFIGIPMDIGTSWRSGTRMGPKQLREQSAMIRPYNIQTGAAPFDALHCADLADIAINTFSLSDSIRLITEAYAAHLEHDFIPVGLGGDHTLTLPVLRAIAAKHGPVALVHVDAHADVNDEMFGEKETHGTVFRRAYEEGLIVPEKVFQIGLRGTGYTAEDFEEAAAWGFNQYLAPELWHKSLSPLAAEIKAKIGETKTYITYDIDSLDPSFAPGTGTPEIGGLTTPQAMELIRGLRGLNIVGCDLVEVSPPYDTSGNTALTGANIIFEMLSILPGVPYR